MLYRKFDYLYSYIIIVFGLILSGYLLFHHFSIFSGRLPGTDLCSVIFGKGCNVASLSSFSVFLKIPLGGWGMIYLVILLCLIFFSQYFTSETTDEFIQTAFWISLIGIMFSLFYFGLMIANPFLFCPVCAIFHVFNFILFFLIRKISKKAFPELIKGLKNALGVMFLAKSTPPDFNKLKWLAIVFSFILGLVIYQWILMQEQNIRIEQFANYNPLNEIEQFESNEIFDIKLSDDDPLLGNVNAPVTMVVFSDFQCSLCEMFASNFKYLLDYNKGKLNIRFKYFPLSSTCNPLLKDKLHPLACESARAGEAARLQGKFWEYHDALFTYGHVKNEEQLFEIARNMNLEMTRFKVDYYSNRGTNKIEMDIQEGIRLNIEGTPTAFLNGRKLTNLSEKNINFLIKFLSKDF